MKSLCNYRQDAVSWSTRTRPRCCSENWAHIPQPGPPSRRATIYSSELAGFREIHSSSNPSNCSYLIENEVCYLVLCDKMFSKRMAFNFLEDISQEFYKNYGRKVNSVTRPYAFIEFDVYITKARKSLTDRRKNINSINTQLQDVQRIMVQNIDDVLQRGTVLSGE